MAATVGHTILNSTKVFSTFIKFGKNTHCRRNFDRCICSSRVCLSASSTDCIITSSSTVDKSVAVALEQDHRGISGYVKYHKHPGVVIERDIHLPPKLIKALQNLLEKYPLSTHFAKVEKLVRYLNQRQPPITNTELAEKTKQIESKISMKGNMENMSRQELEEALEKHKKKVVNQLRRSVYHWKPVQYDAFTSYIYLIGRIASDYSVLLQMFTEISKRDIDFKPTSIFHHGSKVGSGIWAADKLWKTVGEHYCVEESGHMNTIAQLLLQDGNEQTRVTCISGVHFRQFVPSPKEHKFSMVISSYMLMEQSSLADRQQLVQDLWEMTESYLLLVENGTGAGFSLINEAKDFILQNCQAGSQHMLPGHVFAPCPHDKSCPKLRDKNQPCLTESVLRNLDFTSKKLSEKPAKNARYSYVILRKGPRMQDTEWPRVLHPIKSHRHIHLHMCLPCGNLQHVVVTKGKFEKHLYSCAGHVQQGDRLPISLSSESRTTIEDQPDTPISSNSSRDDNHDSVENDISEISSGSRQ